MHNIVIPNQWDSYFDLVGGGRIYFGRSTFKKGVNVGFPPLIGKFQGLTGYPDEPFIITSRRTMFKINQEMESMGGFIPEWLRGDCFEYFWRKRNEVSLLR